MPSPIRRPNLSPPSQTRSARGRGSSRALLADDDVVMYHDAEILRGRDDLLSHFDIGAGRHEHDRRGRQFERPLNQLAYIDRSVIDGALLLHLVGDDLAALVAEQDA